MAHFNITTGRVTVTAEDYPDSASTDRVSELAHVLDCGTPAQCNLVYHGRIVATIAGNLETRHRQYAIVSPDNRNVRTGMFPAGAVTYLCHCAFMAYIDIALVKC